MGSICERLTTSGAYLSIYFASCLSVSSSVWLPAGLLFVCLSSLPQQGCVAERLASVESVRHVVRLTPRSLLAGMGTAQGHASVPCNLLWGSVIKL